MHTQTNPHTYTHTYTHIHIHTHTQTHTHTHTHTYTPITNFYELDELGLEFFRGKILIFRLNRPHRNLVSKFLVYSGFRGFFPRVKGPVQAGYH